MSNIMMPPPRVGRVALAVADLERSISFYRDAIGLAPLARDGDRALMGAGDYAFLELYGQPGIRPVQRATGLYHFAILVPSRHDLAQTLYHLLQSDAPLSGFSDHGVSEAIYLSDPDGHGIEIYRDRPRSDWLTADGRFRMTTEPLDLQGVLSELGERPRVYDGMVDGTFVGHIHLQVAQIAATEKFYSEFIGFELMVRYGTRATFMSANGYHHHLGGNTWAGENLQPASSDSARLLWYEIVLPDDAAVATIADKLERARIPAESVDHELKVTDPSGIQLRLHSAGQTR